MNEKIFKTAKKFIKGIKRKVEFSNIENYLNSMEIQIIFFNTPQGDVEVMRYNLKSKTEKYSAFTYWGTVKIIFIDNDISCEDKLYALLHEVGHILLGHIGDGKLYIRNRILIDIEADAFTHEVLHPRKKKRVFAPCLASILIGFILGGSFACTYFNVDTASVSDITYAEELETEAEYVLVTPSGTKFHRSDCRYVRGKDCTEYTRENASEKYAPCSVCKP